MVSEVIVTQLSDQSVQASHCCLETNKLLLLLLFTFPSDAAVVCPWEAFGDMELSDLAQFGIV